MALLVEVPADRAAQGVLEAPSFDACWVARGPQSPLAQYWYGLLEQLQVRMTWVEEAWEQRGQQGQGHSRVLALPVSAFAALLAGVSA